MSLADGTARAADTTATTTGTDTSVMLNGFRDLVASLRSSSCVAGSIPGANIASIIGKLKIIDKAIAALDAAPSIEDVHLRSDMAEIAVMALPKDTRHALEASQSGSDVAMELVRRNSTQLPVLAKILYTATPEALRADEKLQALHVELASGLELYGALVTHGVNPRVRPWARRLTEKFASLSELRCIAWRRVMHLVDVGTPVGLDAEAEGEASEDEEALEVANGALSAEAREAANTEKQQKQEQAAAIAAALPVTRHPPALSKGEVNVLENLYSTGMDVPPIRQQALEFGLGLDAAGQLEDANITTSSKLTESNIRMFQSKLKVPGMVEDDIKSALMAMVSNKTQPTVVATATDDDENQIFGSYDTNEELVAAAGGGMALYGISFFPNENDVTLKPYAPILKKPAFVEMAGASASFEASVLHSTEQSMASTFTKTTENGGISIAQASSTSWGVSASVSGFGGVGSASVSAEGNETEETTGESKGSNAFSANNKKTTTSATMVEAITCPMKSFRIPVSTMTMSEEALDSALQVDTLLKATHFLDTFGSHVSNGRHLLGGVFFRTMTMTSESEVDTSTLLSAASTQMQQSRTESADSSTSASVPIPVTVAASASMGSASSSGVATFHSKAGKNQSESADSRAMFQTYVRSMGPNVATPELFAQALFTDTSSWTVIDRGPFEALVPITQVLDNMLSSFDPASPGKAQLENAINLMTVAWQQRAAVWKHLEDDPSVPVSLRNMIGRSFSTEDAHDQIRAAVVDLFEVLELGVDANTAEAAESLSSAVLTTAKEMEDKPAGRADFFDTLQAKMKACGPQVAGQFTFKMGTSAYQAAVRSANKLSSTDWAGFDLIWKRRCGSVALKTALDNHLNFEQATLRLGEAVTIGKPLTSVNGTFRLEMAGNSLRVVKADDSSVIGILYQGEGNLGKRTSAHIEANGAFVLDLTMITGFDRTETKMVLWTAPNTEGNKGSYTRMQNNGKFVVFGSNGKCLWTT